MAAEIVVESMGDGIGIAGRRGLHEPEDRGGLHLGDSELVMSVEPAPGEPRRVPERQEAVAAEAFLAVLVAVLQAETRVPPQRPSGLRADREAQGAAAAEHRPVGFLAGRQRGDLPGIGEIDGGAAHAPAARGAGVVQSSHSGESIGSMREGQFDIADRAVRQELAERTDPYWLTFARHRSIGFAKKRAWTWHARFQWPDGAKRKKILGVTADSPHDRPDLERLTFDQAMGRVKLWCAEAQTAGRDWQRHRDPPLAPPEGAAAYTVRHAFWTGWSGAARSACRSIPTGRPTGAISERISAPCRSRSSSSGTSSGGATGSPRRRPGTRLSASPISARSKPAALCSRRFGAGAARPTTTWWRSRARSTTPICTT